MVLLDILRNQPGVELVVAHFEHGIRADSDADRLLVEGVARSYGLPFRAAHGRLGREASEATARTARYTFLREVQQETGAQAIITAHHQDDLLETAILNMIRGTGRKGLTSLRSTNEILRPLLHVPKQELKEYAAQHTIEWHEDSTNADDRYMRNYIRHTIVPELGVQGREKLLAVIAQTASLNPEIDSLIAADLHHHTKDGAMERHWFIMLPHVLAAEVLAAWLREQGVATFDRKTIERLVVAAKTYHPGQLADAVEGYQLQPTRTYLHLLRRSSS